jgi:hypothetical protein
MGFAILSDAFHIAFDFGGLAFAEASCAFACSITARYVIACCFSRSIVASWVASLFRAESTAIL